MACRCLIKCSKECGAIFLSLEGYTQYSIKEDGLFLEFIITHVNDFMVAECCISQCCIYIKHIYMYNISDNREQTIKYGKSLLDFKVKNS